MFIKLKNVVCIIVLFTMLFTSCNNKVNTNNVDTNKKDNNVSKVQNNEINNSEKDSKYATLPQFDIEPDKKVTVMKSWVPPKVGDNNMDLWSVEERLLKKIYDVDIEYIKIPQADVPTKQAAMVMAGDPADVVKLLNYADYPYSFVKGLYEPLDDILPLNDKAYDYIRPYIDALRINGKAYWGINMVRPLPPCFVYNKSLLETADLDDPWDLVEKNEWTWDVFYNYCKELTIDKDGDGTIDQYGGAAVRSFLGDLPSTLGYSISKINENNKVEINLRDAGLMDYYEFLRKISPFGEGVFHPLSFKQGDMIQQVSEEFLNGNIGFYYGWDGGTATNNKFRPMLESGELGITILPKHPNADKQYIKVNAEGLGISKGAEHPQAAAAYITSFVVGHFRNSIEVIEDSERIALEKQEELGIDFSTLYNGKYQLTKSDIYNAMYVNEIPVDKLDYYAKCFYIEHDYIKDYPERVVFDFGQFACLIDYSAFGQIFSGDETGNPITAQQIIEQIQPQMQEKIDKYEKAIKSVE